MTNRIHECYICLEQGNTIDSPCACRTQAHAECLARWVAERKTTTCPVCRRDYRAYVEQRLAELGRDMSAPIIDDDGNDDNDDEIEIVVIEDVDEMDEDLLPEINETLRRQRRRIFDSRPSVSTAESVAENPTYPAVEPFRPFQPPLQQRQQRQQTVSFYPVVEPFHPFQPPLQQIPTRTTQSSRPVSSTSPPPPQPPNHQQQQQPQPPRRRRWKERVRRFFGVDATDDDRPRSLVRVVVIVVVIAVCFIGFVVLL